MTTTRGAQTRPASSIGNIVRPEAVWAGMDDLRLGPRLGAGLLSLTLLLAACGSATTPSPSAAPPDGPTTAPSDAGGSADPGAEAPGPGGAKVVVPRPGQLDVHPVPAERFEATVDGSTVAVSVTWTSGVEPCTILDTVVVEAGEDLYTITLREGRGPEDVVCIAIAEQHRTVVEIPDVDPGTYTIRDQMGGAPDISVTVG